MKIGQVLEQERSARKISAANMASQLGMALADYEAIESGANSSFEEVSGLLLQFNEIIQGQVNQLFYPCGMPFTTVRGYEVTR